MSAIVVLSGGIDSAVVLASTIHYAEEVAAVLHFSYSAKHSRMETEAAFVLAAYYGVKLIPIALPFFDVFQKSSLINEGKEIPEGHFESDSMKSTVIPFRNGIFLSIAIGIAEDLGVDRVLIGAHIGDHAIYPDCRLRFLESFNDAAFHGTYGHLSVSAPLCEMNKIQVVREGIRLGVPFELTQTCYKGGIRACGKCGSCVERLEAFKNNGIADPIKYEEDLNLKINLCDTCNQDMPECDAKMDSMEFGIAAGHDNVIACKRYQKKKEA